MDIVCGICGIEDALYECISCNKKFCIDDWDKVHTGKKHKKLSITFSVNEKSREFLLNFFEKLKEETLIIFSSDKVQALASGKNNVWVFMKYVYLSSLWNAMILYIMRIKTITKKLIYRPIDYFIINPQALAEEYTLLFSLSQFQSDPIDQVQDFLTYNYLVHEPISVFSQDLLGDDQKNLWCVFPDILTYHLIDLNYKNAFELLENWKGILMFHKWFKFEINDTISTIQAFITQILNQNCNMNLIFWKQAENKINRCRIYNEALIFYMAFQVIFYNLMNRKYFVWCSKCILRITKTINLTYYKRFYMGKIYKLITDLYGMEDNYKQIKYTIKTLHLWEKNNQLLIFDSISVIQVLINLNQLIYIYSHTNQIAEKNKCIYKFLHFVKNYKPACPSHLIFLLFNYGKFYYLNENCELALDYFKRALQQIKRNKCKEKSLIDLINYYLGDIYYKIGDYQNSIKKLYKAKEHTEMQFGNFLDFRMCIYFTLGKINFHRMWLDESLKYFSLAKYTYLKLNKNRKPKSVNTVLYYLEYNIAYVYYQKGEINRPLKSFENLLYLLEHGEVDDLNITYSTILLNIRIGYLYSWLGNLDKFNYHIDLCLKNFYTYMNCSNFKIDIIHEVLPAIINVEDYKRYEEICLKLLEMLPNGNNNYEKLKISIFLMIAYANQENYEKFNELAKSTEWNLSHFNWYDKLKNQASIYMWIGEAFLKINNYYKADIAFKKAKDIYENFMKTQVYDKALLYKRMGWNYVRWGKYEDSEYYLLEALNIFLNVHNDVISTMHVLRYLGASYRKKKDFQNEKHYLLEYVKFCKEKNFYPTDHYYFLGLLVNIFKREKDDANGIEYWYELRECLKKSNADLYSIKELVLHDENKCEIGRFSLIEY